MKRLFQLILSVVFCMMIVVGFMEGTKQVVDADNGRYGKYVSSEDQSTYVELKPDSSCYVVARVYSPSGKPTKEINTLHGTYEIKGNIVTLKLITRFKPLISEFKLEGNALVPIKPQKGQEGAKLIRK